MNKDSIEYRTKLREGIGHLFNKPVTEKAKPHPQAQTQDQNAGPNHVPSEERTGKKEYADVRRAFEKLGGPSMVDIMKITGIEDDEKGVNRSLFRKKVKQIKNPDTGSIYQFDEKELADVRAAIDIK